MVTRNRLAVLLLTIPVTGAVSCLVHRSDPVRPPLEELQNVVLISIDTCRADHLSCYGDSRQTTPHIDAIARDGVLFSRAQSTNPVTLPAHCSMLTGTTPMLHGVHHNLGSALNDSNVTLAEILQDQGYQTGAVVGAFPLHSKFGLDQGFDHYDEQFSTEGERLVFNERNAEEVSRAAIGWLEQRRDKPFFLFVHYFDPHQPYQPPEPFASALGNDRYAGEIAYTDSCIGQIIETLKKLDLFDSTLIVITADHGESLGEHDEDTHGFFLYQGTLRVPLIIRAPAIAAGRKVNDAVGLIDIVPTVLSLLELKVPPQIEGVDLSGYLRGRGETAEDRFLYSESWTPASFGCCPLRGLVHGKWRYIWSVKPELYDLSRDPAETNNLVDEQEATSKLLEYRLQEMLADARQSTEERRSPALDQQTVQRLQTLGYVGGSVVNAGLDLDSDMEDPKDFIGMYKQYMVAQSHWGRQELDEAKAQLVDILARRRRMLPAMLLLGSIAVDQGQIADAINHFSQVLAMADEAIDHQVYASEVFQAHYKRGDAYSKSGSHALALEDFNNVIELKPAFAEAYADRGLIRAKLGQFEPALADFARAIELEPDHAAAYSNRGNAYLDLRKFDLALADFDRAIELDAGQSTDWYNRGNVYLYMNEFDRAVADFSKAIKLNPKFEAAYNNRGLCYRQLRRFDDALADFTQAIKLKPDFAQAWINRGVAYRQQRRFDLAIANFGQAIELEPDNAQAHNNRGTVYFQLGKLGPARADFAQVIELEPRNFQAYSNRGSVYVQLGRHDQALTDFDRAIELQPAYATAWYNRGSVHVQLGRFEQALGDYAKAIELQPRDARAPKALAWLLATCPDSAYRDGQKSLFIARQAHQLSGRSDYGTLETLAAAHAENGQFADAVKWQTQAIELAPAGAKTQVQSRLRLYRAGKPYRGE